MSARPFSQPFVRPADLDGRHFSTVIVGAGINGVGVFRDLSLQGVDCLVVDKGDFASGASSAPSRMIHGGLRYLEGGAFSLVAESTRERNRLLQNAPHLVRPLETVVPLSSHFGGLLSSLLRFTGLTAAPSERGLFVVALGLRLYDLLGRRQRTMPDHKIQRVGAVDGALFRASVRWTATYFDAWIRHPEWLVLELIHDACRDQPASAAANHCQVMGCEGHTLVLRDELTGQLSHVTADVVVNATGAWLDRAARPLAGTGDRVMGTKGSHLVLAHPALREALASRMAYFEATDGRVCIVYPFLDRILVGSTDILIDDPDQVRTEAVEIDYLLEVLRELFPALHFGRDQVVYTYVGVRPLARAPGGNPGQISRDHAIAVDPPNATRAVPLVNLVGGKWTTFRALAEQATDRVLTELKVTRTRSTQDLPIGGGAHFPQSPAETERFVAQIQAACGVTHTRAVELLARYGSNAFTLVQAFSAPDDVPLQHAPSYSVGEVRHLCRHTGVEHLDDLVLRRTLLAIRGELNAAALSELADIAAVALGWSSTRRDTELQTCAALLRERHHVHLSVHEPVLPASLEASSKVSAPLFITPVTT